MSEFLLVFLFNLIMMIPSSSSLIVDPTAEEEQLSLGNITVVTRDSEIVYLLQSGGISIDPKQLDKCIEINMTRSRYIQALVLSVFKDL